MKKKYWIYTFSLIFILALAVGTTTYAQTVRSGQRPWTTIAEAIAKKFNLTTTDVQKVIDETMTTERTQREAGQLTQAVADGKLTQAQADLITAKRAELRSERENLGTATAEERATIMKTHAETLKQWATDNNIPEQYVLGGLGRGMGGGRGFNKAGGPNHNDEAPMMGAQLGNN